ncbi:hypothetical protein AMTR_s00076p00165160 [Amborella trichopoda]|uniref:Uncharacterized protein n=1 Tax=Amborella trichopoda TaxID=13333 RepID=W1PCF7_AMBTC|nr:hypothetical protein AMTR_s00076p00165160 [Amborella trichopoda]
MVARRVKWRTGERKEEWVADGSCGKKRTKKKKKWGYCVRLREAEVGAAKVEREAEVAGQEKGLRRS